MEEKDLLEHLCLYANFLKQDVFLPKEFKLGSTSEGGTGLELFDKETLEKDKSMQITDPSHLFSSKGFTQDNFFKSGMLESNQRSLDNSVENQRVTLRPIRLDETNPNASELNNEKGSFAE